MRCVLRGELLRRLAEQRVIDLVQREARGSADLAERSEKILREVFAKRRC